MILSDFASLKIKFRFNIDFNQILRAQKYSECDVEDLLVRLDAIYTELNSTLERNRGFLISISVVSPTMVTASSNIILGGQTSITKSRGAAEALLFGHLAEALSNPMTSHLLMKHLALLAFVRNILEEYFLTPLRSPKNTLRTSLWEVQHSDLLQYCPYLIYLTYYDAFNINLSAFMKEKHPSS